jgi:hypothetical protein
MDIWGVDSIEAEGELLASLTSALISMGLTSSDVVVRVRASRLADSAPDSALVPLSLSTDQLQEADRVSPHLLR